MTPTSAVRDTRRVRHPSDAARFCVAAAVSCASIVIALHEPAGVRAFSSDLVHLVSRLPEPAARAIVGAIQLAALVGPVALLFWLRRGRPYEVVLAACTALSAGVLAAVLDGRLSNALPPEITQGGHQASWVTGSAFPSGAYLGFIAGVVTVVGASHDRSWRRASYWAIFLVAFARVVTAVDTIFGLVVTISLGIAVGSLALYAVGSPLRVPSVVDLSRALDEAGLNVDQLELAAVRAGHEPTFRGRAGDQQVFIKVVGRDERDADLLARLIRWLQVKGVEDQRPLGQRLAVEHEAINALLASRAGVTVPGVWAVGNVADGDGFLVLDRLEGQRMSDLTAEDLGDDVLRAAFHQLRILHQARIAHRWASMEHFMCLSDGTVAVVDFRWAERSADDASIGRDVAELLASTAVVVGPERAVAGAASALPAEQLVAALPMLQPLALTSGTRQAVHHVPKLLETLRDQVQQASNAPTYEMAELKRLSLRSVLTLAGALVLGNLLLGLVANFGDIWRTLKEVDLLTIPTMIILVAASYASGALSLMGAVNVRLSFVRTTEIMFAQSFLSRFTPANAGGMALRTRYLQRNGVELVVAAAGVGLTSVASGVMQIVVAGVFFEWAGSSAENTGHGLSLPSGQTAIMVVVIVLVAAGILYATAFGKRVFKQARIELRTVKTELAQVAKQPTKLLLLFGGAFAGKVLSVLMLAEALQAFGLRLPLAQLGAMYITVTAIAAAAPTPGGVGAIEAALAAGLIGLKVDPATAVAVVLYFRLMSYWFPVLPCWAALRHVQRAEIV